MFDSHKYLNINLAEEYLTERIHLPLPPQLLEPSMKEAFMAVNIMNDDPDYLISNLLEPAKLRFIKEEDNRYKFKSYSFGVIYS
jgi:hypothetical protein